MTPEELKTEVARIIDDHVAAVQKLDTREKYADVTTTTSMAITKAIKAFCAAQAAEITESHEVLFVRKYGQPSELVREQYIKLLEDNSRNDSTQHRVMVDGYNRRGAHHKGLKPEAYAFCKPDERVKAAFAVIDARCEIEEKTHFEHWGN